MPLCTDDGVDVRGSVKGHMRGREVLKGMLPYNIESLSRVFEFRMIPSTRSDGEALPFSAQRFFNWGDPSELVQM